MDRQAQLPDASWHRARAAETAVPLAAAAAAAAAAEVAAAAAAAAAAECCQKPAAPAAGPAAATPSAACWGPCRHQKLCPDCIQRLLLPAPRLC